MSDKYIPKIGELFNAYETLKSGRKHKHFMSPFKCSKIDYQTQQGVKYPVQVESKDFRFCCKLWKFEKVNDRN